MRWNCYTDLFLHNSQSATAMNVTPTATQTVRPLPSAGTERRPSLPFARITRKESDPAPWWFRWKLFEIIDFFGQDGYDRCVLFLGTLNFFQTVGQVFVGCQDFPELDEGTHDEDIHLRSTFAGQHGGEHGHPMLGESVRQIPPAATALF